MWYNYPIWSGKIPSYLPNMQTVMNREISEMVCWKWLLLYRHRFDEEARIPLQKPYAKFRAYFASGHGSVKRKPEFDFGERISSRKSSTQIGLQ